MHKYPVILGSEIPNLYYLNSYMAAFGCQKQENYSSFMRFFPWLNYKSGFTIVTLYIISQNRGILKLVKIFLGTNINSSIYKEIIMASIYSVYFIYSY